MSLRALAASGFVFIVASVLVAACGGKVDGVSSSGASGGSSLDPTPRLPPPSGGRPGRRPADPATAASLASEIAEAYCKAFSGCCVGTGQPPIDVARCRQLVAADVEGRVASSGELDAVEVEICVGTIKGRVAACGQVDAAWWASSFPLLGPSSVANACAPVFGLPGAGSGAGVCTSDASCASPGKCAIDQCVADRPLGAKCATTSDCLDGPVCIANVCSARSDVMPKGPCSIDDDCQLGLVCAKGVCLPARDFPGLAKPRSSPYRIGADTCRAFTYL